MIITNGGIEKRISTGFSWKLLLFGVFYPLFRGDIKGFWICFLWSMITCGAAWLVLPFTYNKKYLHRMVEKGWSVK